MREYKLYINGEFVDAESKQTFDSIDPFNQQIVARAARAGIFDAQKAIRAAREASTTDRGRECRATNRSAFLKGVSDKINERAKELVALEVDDSGSTIRKAKEDIFLSARCMNYYSKIAANELSENVEGLSKPGFSQNILVREPLGVSAAIIPWNFPLKMAVLEARIYGIRRGQYHRVKALRTYSMHSDGIGSYLPRSWDPIETPTIQPLYGGGDAEPFTTKVNTLREEQYLRIADELYLKRLIIGGFSKVYEICKDFRNEDLDSTHSPEFTMIEWYQAYADYEEMMKLTEGMFEYIATELNGTQSVTYNGKQLSFKAPFKRVSFIDSIKTTRSARMWPSSATMSFSSWPKATG